MSVKGSRSRAGKEYYKNDSYWKSTSFHKKHSSKERLFKEEKDYLKKGYRLLVRFLLKSLKKDV